MSLTVKSASGKYYIGRTVLTSTKTIRAVTRVGSCDSEAGILKGYGIRTMDLYRRTTRLMLQRAIHTCTDHSREGVVVVGKELFSDGLE